MKTETQRVLIVAKTRRGSGACIGAISEDGRSLRLEAANAESDEHAGMEYQVGDVWEVTFAPHPHIIPPHVETVVVYGKRRLRQAVDPIRSIEQFMPPVEGGVHVLYDGLLQHSPAGALYIAQGGRIPSHSTMFWRPDRPLRLTANGLRLHYAYPDEAGERRLAFVGFQEPVDEIPAGAIVRVSLAHWWRSREHPEDDLRCYVQLSGWFLPEVSTNPHVGVRTGQDMTSPSHPLTQPTSSRTPFHSHTPVDRARVRQTLREVFGYDTFRPLQEEIVTGLLAGRDTLAVMPTGAGKSLCYQLPALLWERLTVVVSPLIALMQDQVDALRALGVAAAYLNSTLSYSEQRRLMECVAAGEIKLLYVAPETLVRPEVLHLLDTAGVDCLAVDEAHCISAWGHDFRPEYRQLEPVRRRFANAVCLAMTATAAPRVRADIKHSLGIQDAGEIVASFDRPNLFLTAQARGNGKRDLLAFLAHHRGESGIIYCIAKRTVDGLAAELTAQGYAARPYHAGLDDTERSRNQRAFVRDETPIIVATVAFGMGINKPNVRFVVHYNLPSSLEQYYQEIGRAGRDGLRADCLLLYHPQDVMLHSQMNEDGAAEERAGRSARLQAMLRFAQMRTCRRPPLLHYFGEERSEANCGFCDNCKGDANDQPQVDVTEAARKFFACVLHTNQLFGAGHIIDVLRGSHSQKVMARRHDRLPEYGTGKEQSAAEWRDLAQQWIQGGWLHQDMEHGGLRLTERGHAVLNGEQAVLVERRSEPQVEVGSGKISILQGTGLPAYDFGLFEHLRSLRRQLADAANLPPYIVFSDRTLIEMAAYIPRTPEELLAVNGVGRAKLQTYGAQFLEAIGAYAAEHGLQPQAQQAQASAPSVTRPHLGGRRADEVGALYAEGRSLDELQALYDVKRGTVVSHLRDYVQNGGALDTERLRGECSLSVQEQERVFAQFAALGSERLGPIHEALEGEVKYDDLHLLRLVWWMIKAGESVSGSRTPA